MPTTQTADQDLYAKAWNETEKTAMLGDGMVKQAANAINGRAYKLHVEEAKATGETPMTPEAFAKSQKQS